MKGYDPHEKSSIKSIISKELMSKIRNGDYQHAGEEEAINLVFENIEKNKQLLLLDVGSGLGGTAAFIQNAGWGDVFGIDINPDVVESAKLRHPECKFFHMSVDKITNSLLSSVEFDIIYMFNSFFLFPDHKLALREISSVARTGAKLLLFDYIDYGNYMSNPYRENEVKILPNILKNDDIDVIFCETNWKVISCKNIDDYYINWYKELFNKIISHENKSECLINVDTFRLFKNRYEHILDVLEKKIIGGIVIEAEKMDIF